MLCIHLPAFSGATGHVGKGSFLHRLRLRFFTCLRLRCAGRSSPKYRSKVASQAYRPMDPWLYGAANGGEIELSGRDKPVGAAFALNKAAAGKGEMRADETLLVRSEVIEESQSGRYSAVGIVIDRNPPRWVLE
jgi:hypothetical protein